MSQRSDIDLKKTLTVLCGLVLVLGVVLIVQAPASGHQYDGWSYWYCSVKRPAAQSTWSVHHSTPVWLSSATVIYHCLAVQASGRTVQYDVLAEVPLEEGNSELSPDGYELCYPWEGWETVCYHG